LLWSRWLVAIRHEMHIGERGSERLRDWRAHRQPGPTSTKEPHHAPFESLASRFLASITVVQSRPIAQPINQPINDEDGEEPTRPKRERARTRTFDTELTESRHGSRRETRRFERRLSQRAKRARCRQRGQRANGRATECEKQKAARAREALRESRTRGAFGDVELGSSGTRFRFSLGSRERQRWRRNEGRGSRRGERQRQSERPLLRVCLVVLGASAAAAAGALLLSCSPS